MQSPNRLLLPVVVAALTVLVVAPVGAELKVSIGAYKVAPEKLVPATTNTIEK